MADKSDSSSAGQSSIVSKAEEVVQKGVAYAQEKAFGADRSSQSSEAQAPSNNADPAQAAAIDQLKTENVEEFIRDKHRSDPPSNT